MAFSRRSLTGLIDGLEISFDTSYDDPSSSKAVEFDVEFLLHDDKLVDVLIVTLAAGVLASGVPINDIKEFNIFVSRSTEDRR